MKPPMHKQKRTATEEPSWEVNRKTTSRQTIHIKCQALFSAKNTSEWHMLQSDDVTEKEITVFRLFYMDVVLILLCLASYKKNNCKLCSAWSDAAERGVWSGSARFALHLGISVKQNYHKKTSHTPSIWKQTGPINSTRHKWVYYCIFFSVEKA